MLKVTGVPFLIYATEPHDIDLLADIRQEAMKEEWVANGLHDHAAYRKKFKQTFDPAFTRKIVLHGKTVGFYVLWEPDDYLYLERLYLQPKVQSCGIGSRVLGILKHKAEELGKPIRLETFPESRVNAFYLRNGFQLVSANKHEKCYKFTPTSVTVPT